jgi:hypothetical protein
MDEYLDTSAAAAILEVTNGWVTALCRTKVLQGSSKRSGKWEIPRAAVEKLALERAGPVAEEDLLEVGREIEQDNQAQEFAKEEAEESFKDRVITIARKYGAAVLCVVAAAIGNVLAPGNLVSGPTLGAGITWILSKFGDNRRLPISPKQDKKAS